MRVASLSARHQRNSQQSPSPIMYSNPRVLAFVSLFLIVVASSLLVGRESIQIHSIVDWTGDQSMTAAENTNLRQAQASLPSSTDKNDEQSQQQAMQHHNYNRFALSPGELPGYTGWARPEQTLAGYFNVDSLSHPPAKGVHTKYHSIIESGDKFSLLLTCNHNATGDIDADEPPYACPSTGGTLFYVRAYGPSVITGIVADHRNTSYSVEMQFIDPGEYTLEVVVTFSVPLDFDEFPLNGEDDVEPGYEGYMASGFPLSILVNPAQESMSSPSAEQDRKPWCTRSQLTETSPHSALYKGHWQVIDNVARSSHQPLTPDETMVSLDGYRMGLNSVGVRMRYEYEDCELIHIQDLAGGINGGMDSCLEKHLGFHIRNQTLEDVDYDDNFEGVHVILVGDSVMRLTNFFFHKLVRGSSGIKTTFIETNGGIHATIKGVMSSLEKIQQKEKGSNVKRVIQFNSGLHDIDRLCCSKRTRTLNTTKSCSDAYREAMEQLVHVIDDFPAELKVFRSTTAGWHKHGNYGFSWQANDMQPMSRSTHLAHHFNSIAHDIIQKQSSDILIADGYWLTLPRPDHTETSTDNRVGKHLVHPGFEVRSIFARRWFMLMLWGLCGDSFEDCMSCMGGGSSEQNSEEY